MNSTELIDSIAATVSARDDLVLSRAPLASVRSVGRASQPALIVQAGLHGDERAGPITIARHLDRIATLVHSSGMQLVVFPLANPTGFDAGTRYNADGDRGAVGNNDFLRYLRADGTLVDEVAPGEAFVEWRWSNEGPAETRALRDMLRASPLERVVAAIDLHQDCITADAGAASYAYAFPPLHVYAPIVARVRELVPILANAHIDAGYHGAPHTSDADGLLVRHDGSFSDLMFRLGARHSIAVETTGATPDELACAVNLVWIEGIVGLLRAAANT